jgi:hypothetical protein
MASHQPSKSARMPWAFAEFSAQEPCSMYPAQTTEKSLRSKTPLPFASSL